MGAPVAYDPGAVEGYNFHYLWHRSRVRRPAVAGWGAPFVAMGSQRFHTVSRRGAFVSPGGADAAGMAFERGEERCC